MGVQIDVQQLRARPVRQVQIAVGIEADDALSHAGENGLGEAAALVELPVRLHQFVALRLDLPRHPVERPAEQVQFVTGSRRRHTHAEVARADPLRSEEHTSELQSLMRISYAVFCLKKKILKLRS